MKYMILFITFISLNSFSEGLTGTDNRALKQTQSLLKSPTHRQNYIDQHQPAQIADEALLDAVGGDPAKKQRAYELSSGIFETLVNKTGGDPNKLSKLVMQLRKNPEALEAMMTPEQKKLLKQMTNELQDESFTAGQK